MAVRNPRLPFLPGLTFNTELGRTSYGRKPLFTTIGNVNMLIDKASDINRVPSLYARKAAPDLPAWIIYDKQILRFEGYFQQTLQEMRCATSILRRVNVFFYLEDGTIKVMEPRVENSGLLQGVMISRQRIKLPFSYDTFYDVLDLNIGRQVEFFGKVFMIINCDNFTRVYLNRLGIHVPDPINMPSLGPETVPQKPLKACKKFTFKQFLEFDRKVLCFKGYWDDRESESGIIHHLEIQYYLADDTIEIKEMLPSNSGRESGTKFLKRSRLPKKIPSRIEMTGGPPIDTFLPSDLIIGAVLNVYGRKVVLTDCDPFTRKFYRVKYGIDDFTPLETLKDTGNICISTSIAERELPPWNGYGSYEDSAENCRTVEPKPPHKDFIKFLHKDRLLSGNYMHNIFSIFIQHHVECGASPHIERHNVGTRLTLRICCRVGYDSHVLRFAARLVSDIPENKVRYFIVSYYLSDDTIGVFELGERNSGFIGGRFFKRDTMYLPGQNRYVPLPPPAYNAQDMWIGNELIINEHRFKLFAADEYAIRYMELHQDEFPKARVGLIMDRIRRALATGDNRYKSFVAKYMVAVLPDKKHLMPLQCFKEALKEVLCEKMTEHEFITIARHFRGDVGAVNHTRPEMIRSMVFSVLTCQLWDDRQRLKESLLHADERGLGLLSRHRLRQVLKGNRLPLHDQLMDCMLNCLETSDDCLIRYDNLMEFLDFKTNPVPCTTETQFQKLMRHATPAKHEECQGWIDMDSFIKSGFINWEAFLCQLDLEHIVK